LLQPSSTVDVYPEAAGKVEDIYISEGQWVEKDAALAQLEKTDYQLGVDQAEAALALAQQVPSFNTFFDDYFFRNITLHIND